MPVTSAVTVGRGDRSDVAFKESAGPMGYRGNLLVRNRKKA